MTPSLDAEHKIISDGQDHRGRAPIEPLAAGPLMPPSSGVSEGFRANHRFRYVVPLTDAAMPACRSEYGTPEPCFIGLSLHHENRPEVGPT
jgi:hypothetical protein